MPYKIIGKDVYKKEHGHFKLVAHHKSLKKAKSQIHLLHAVEHGWKPTGRKLK